MRGVRLLAAECENKMQVEVSDLFDSLHELAVIIWTRFLFRGGVPREHPNFDDVTRGLEVEVFFPACARRLWQAAGITIPHDEVEDMLRLHNLSGAPLEGMAAEYHMNGFDWGTPMSETVQNQVVGGDGMPRPRTEVRLFLHAPDAA